MHRDSRRVLAVIGVVMILIAWPFFARRWEAQAETARAAGCLGRPWKTCRVPPGYVREDPCAKDPLIAADLQSEWVGCASDFKGPRGEVTHSFRWLAYRLDEEGRVMSIESHRYWESL